MKPYMLFFIDFWGGQHQTRSRSEAYQLFSFHSRRMFSSVKLQFVSHRGELITIRKRC